MAPGVRRPRPNRLPKAIIIILMPFGLIYFLLIPLGLVVAFYLIIPLILRSQQRYPASPQLLEMRFETLKPSLAKFLMTRTHALFMRFMVLR